MKRKIVMAAIIVIGIALLLLAGFHFLRKPTETYTLVPLEDPEGIYQAAVSSINTSENQLLKITCTNEMTVGDSVFTEISDITIQYGTLPSGQACIAMQEQLRSGTHNINISELFTENTLYTTVNGVPFSADCTLEEYEITLVPALLLTATQYGKIEGIDNGSCYRISFSEPIAPEGWLSAEPLTLLEATGTATVNYDHTLTESTYTATYLQNGITLRTEVHVQPQQPPANVTPIEDISLYKPITNRNIPKLLERACGFLTQANMISAYYKDSIYFQAFGDLYTQNITLHAVEDSQWSMDLTTETRIQNDTKQDHETLHTKHERYVDGEYFVSTNGNPPAPNTSITADTVCGYFQDRLVSTLILPQDIANAEMEQQEDILKISFTGTEAFGQFIFSNACQLLYGNRELITDPVSVDTLTCYLEISAYTGLPIASGIDFIGSYKTQGIPYRLEYSASQDYQIPGTSAKSEIEKAAVQ